MSDIVEARVRRYAEAIADAESAATTPTFEELANAAIAVADEEQAALRADRNVAYGMLTSAQHRAEAAEAELADTRERLRQAEERLAAIETLAQELHQEGNPEHAGTRIQMALNGIKSWRPR